MQVSFFFRSLLNVVIVRAELGEGERNKKEESRLGKWMGIRLKTGYSYLGSLTEEEGENRIEALLMCLQWYNACLPGPELWEDFIHDSSIDIMLQAECLHQIPIETFPGDSTGEVGFGGVIRSWKCSPHGMISAPLKETSGSFPCPLLPGI